MTLTSFAYAYMPLVLYVGLFARCWLPALLIFSTCLQAVSVVNIPYGEGIYGVSPYSLTALFAGMVLCARLVIARDWKFAFIKHDLALGLMLGYVGISTVGGLVLPHLFAGMPVNLLNNQLGMDQPPVPQRFTIANVAQVINLMVHLVVMLFLIQSSQRKDWHRNRTLGGFVAAITLVLGLGFYERVATITNLPSMIGFWASNQHYLQLHDAKMGGVLRIVLPFTEASYTSAFLAATLVGLFAMAGFGRKMGMPLIGAALVCLGLLNTLGATGWVAGAAGVFVVAVWLGFKGIRKRREESNLPQRAKMVWLSLAFFAFLFLWLWQASPYSQRVNSVLDETVISKTTHENAKARQRSNEHALIVVRDTYGLGVGLGSNRASSFFASLVSNTGVVGSGCFVGMLLVILRRYMREPFLSDAQIFVSVALVTATLAMAVAIPDLNLPMYWAFIFLAFLYRPSQGYNFGKRKYEG